VYDYITPPGNGDQFFQYAFNADALTDGSSYPGQVNGINIYDYDFICRNWAGMETVINTATAGGIQIYDNLKRQWFSTYINLASFAQGQCVLPEKRYPVNSRIGFDLLDVARLAVGGSTFASQLVFTGARRIPGQSSDPAPSSYKYKLKRFCYPYTLTVNAYAGGAVIPQQTIAIDDYDFELWRVEMTTYHSPSPFSIWLYDTNRIQRSNIPINANRFFHFDPALSSGENNFWPCPPLVYKVASVIRFDIASLLLAPTVLPQTYQLLFHGARRIPCP
jgi:hypothetical protein